MSRWALLVFVAAFAPMLIEAVRSAHNERTQRARGGIEPEDDVYGAMRIAYPASFAAMIAELWVRGNPAGAAMATGVVVFVIAKAIKWWAILSLGTCWTFRVIAVPGAVLVGAGPYRFMRHPNYVGVMGELAGIALMTGALVSGPLALAVFAVLLWKRIAVEERALQLRA